MVAKPMKLFWLGATGGVGRAAIEQGIARGHRITAFVRSPQKLTARSGLTIVQGNPRSAEALQAVLPGHDAVLSSLGPGALGPTTICREGAKATITAMQATGLRRLLVVSAAMLFEDAGLLAAFLRSVILRNAAEDSREMDRLVMASGLDWTISRPPRLTNGPLTERYNLADGHMPKGGGMVSRADVAHFLLDEVERSAHVRQIVGMAARKG